MRTLTASRFARTVAALPASDGVTERVVTLTHAASDPSCLARMLVAVALGLVSIAAPPVSATAAIIYQENFDGSGSTNLAGLAPDVAPGAQTWGGATEFKANGFVTGGFSGIYLPFTPTAGFVYTLSGSFQVASGDWLGIGFAGGSAVSNTTFGANSGRGWVIAKNGEIQAFIGPSTSGGASQSTISPQTPAGVVTRQTITLDASSSTPANWTFSATQVIGSTSYTVWTNQPANITSAGDITAVGLSATAASGTFTNFTLSAVPEPSTLVMGAAGIAYAGWGAFRRRKRA